MGKEQFYASLGELVEAWAPKERPPSKILAHAAWLNAGLALGIRLTLDAGAAHLGLAPRSRRQCWRDRRRGAVGEPHMSASCETTCRSGALHDRLLLAYYHLPAVAVSSGELHFALRSSRVLRRRRAVLPPCGTPSHHRSCAATGRQVPTGKRKRTSHDEVLGFLSISEGARRQRTHTLDAAGTAAGDGAISTLEFPAGGSSDAPPTRRRRPFVWRLASLRRLGPLRARCGLSAPPTRLTPPEPYYPNPQDEGRCGRRARRRCLAAAPSPRCAAGQQQSSPQGEGRSSTRPPQPRLSGARPPPPPPPRAPRLRAGRGRRPEAHTVRQQLLGGRCEGRAAAAPGLIRDIIRDDVDHEYSVRRRLEPSRTTAACASAHPPTSNLTPRLASHPSPRLSPLLLPLHPSPLTPKPPRLTATRARLFDVAGARYAGAAIYELPQQLRPSGVVSSTP